MSCTGSLCPAWYIIGNTLDYTSWASLAESHKDAGNTYQSRHAHRRAHISSLILNNTHMGHFHNTHRTSRRREMEGASGKRENKGEEVSTLLGGLACSFPLGDIHTSRRWTHTGVRTHTCWRNRWGLKKKKKKKKKVANARAELADADGAEHMRVIFPHLQRSTSGAEQRSLLMTHQELWLIPSQTSY